jgi:NAD-dependent SIR2 family protein deacetylase
MMKEAEHAVASAQVFLVIGTSANVYPAAGLIPFARQNGAKVIEINTDDTQFTDIVDCALRGPAGELLPRLIAV